MLSCVPDVPRDRECNTAQLFQGYGLGPEEIAFIGAQVAAHDGELFGDSELSEAGEE